MNLRRHAVFLVLLAPIAAGYLWLNWYDGMGSLMGDGLIYVSTARHFAPYWPAHPVDEMWAQMTQFPPAYTALLAATGGAADYRLAHAVTALGFVAAFIAFYAWLVVALGMARHRAAIGTALLALAPGTFLLSLHIYPEGMYVALAFATLIALARGEQTREARYFWMASLAIGAAILTRTVGITLLPALFVALVLTRPRGWPLIFLLALAPSVIWSVVHDSPINYSTSLKQRYLQSDIEVIVQSLRDSVEAAIFGLLHNLNQNPSLRWFGVPLAAIAVAMTIKRFFTWRPDAWYLAAYLAVLCIWPYPFEGPRLTWVVVPILLGYIVQAGEQLAERVRASSGWTRPAIRWAPVAALALMILPEFALLAARSVHPLARENPAYRHFPQWYEPSLKRAQALTEMHLGVATAFTRFAPQIPPDGCFFSTLEDLGSFYMRLPAQQPPPPSIDDATFNDELRQAGCRYFVFSSASSHDGEPDFYPYERVRDRVRIIDEHRMAIPGNPVVVQLGELKD